MFYVNKNKHLTEVQRRMIEELLNDQSGRGFVTHSSQQRSVKSLEAKGFCKTEPSRQRSGMHWTLTVKVTTTKSLAYGQLVDVSANRS